MTQSKPFWKELEGKEYCNCKINTEEEQCKLGYPKEEVKQAFSKSLERLKGKKKYVLQFDSNNSEVFEAVCLQDVLDEFGVDEK